jgi:outer membrane protein TolC
VELEKQRVQLRYQGLEAKKARNVLLPTVNLEGTLSFSGPAYPLTRPTYGLRATVTLGGDLLPVNLGGGVTAQEGRLGGSNASLGTTAPPSLTWSLERRQADVTLAEGGLGLVDTELALDESTWDTALAHDAALAALETEEATLGLMEKRARIDRVKLDQGSLKRIDYLTELCDIADKQAAIIELEFRLLAAKRALEIAAGLAYGTLENRW